MTSRAIADIRGAENLDDLYRVFNENHLTAGWHKKRSSLWPEPRTSFQPLNWRYAEAAEAMDRAGAWMSTEDAERRNLLMFNPVDDNDYDTVRTLVCAYQMIKPGEYARTHRHTANAMRLILDAEDGVFTVVNGIKLPMRAGDVLLTPNWHWHSHYNEGAANAYWIDVLDVPLVHRLEPMFCENLPGGHQEVTSVPDPEACPFVFGLERMRAELEQAPARADGTRRHRLDIDAHIPTVAVTYIDMPAGGRMAEPRTTASRILAVLSGAGAAQVGERRFEWTRGDVFCVPSWHAFEVQSASPALLLEVSDEPTLSKLGFFIRDPAQPK
ncbi:cupin domain-containing protein [Xanthobacter agilis]|uniref:Gentisate 1,2-dioxygenase n=1 Tax=Xanthobacter agilis TaxID=47492 RepID=A0ABU0L8Z9_XANAG|nr:cupin domain-containing protein [Xanthobacter agilis]MDQ0503609.1 gentisate 1,2-dioxygenase [Xanthobacter agilis]